MRVTAAAKQATRERIVESAHELFTSKGFEETTTRDLARAAGIASGTLFNYFPSKEALALELIAEALERAHERFAKQTPEIDSLAEDLFAYIATGLRELRPCRAFVDEVLDAPGPMTTARGEDPADSLQTRHLEVVHGLAVKHGLDELPPMALQLYWTLYTGVLSFWSRDTSPHQEDTLGLLDQSLRMFVGWLGAEGDDRGERLHREHEEKDDDDEDDGSSRRKDDRPTGRIRL